MTCDIGVTFLWWMMIDWRGPSCKSVLRPESTGTHDFFNVVWGHRSNGTRLMAWPAACAWRHAPIGYDSSLYKAFRHTWVATRHAWVVEYLWSECMDEANANNRMGRCRLLSRNPMKWHKTLPLGDNAPPSNLWHSWGGRNCDFLYIFEIVGDLSWGHLGHIIRYPALVSTRSSGRVPGYRVPWNS